MTESIKNNIDDANKFKELSELKLKEYEKILEDAKKEVVKIYRFTPDKDIKSKKEVMEKEIEKEMLKAQKEIIELKEIYF